MYDSANEEPLCQLCEERHGDICQLDGDWEVKFYLDSCLILTYITAGSEKQAIRLAEAKIEEELGIILEPDEIVIELKGIYA